MSVTLYHIPDYASTIVHVALEETGAPFTLHPLDIEAGDLATPAFRAVNPLGLIPAMMTPQGPMFETAAILLWLVDTHGRLGPRHGEAGREAFLSWLFFTSNALHTAMMDHIHPERAAGEGLAPAIEAAALARLHDKAAQLDALIAREAPWWLSADRPGVLAPYVGTLLRWSAMLPADPALRFDLSRHPHLRAVLAAAESTPAARRVAHKDGLGPHPFTAPGA